MSRASRSTGSGGPRRSPAPRGRRRRLVPSMGCWATPSTSSGGSMPTADRMVGMRSITWVNCERMAPGLGDVAGPLHDQRRPGAAQPGVALPQLVRGVARPGPGPRVVVVGAEAAPVVVGRQVVRHGLAQVGGEAVLVDAAVLAPFGAGPVVGEDHDERVLEEAGRIEGVQETADLRIGMGQETGEHLLLARRACGARPRRGRPSPAPTRAAR